MNWRDYAMVTVILCFLTLWLFWAKGCDLERIELEHRLEMEKVHVYGKPEAKK